MLLTFSERWRGIILLHYKLKSMYSEAEIEMKLFHHILIFMFSEVDWGVDG